jgi:hypothetical protein
MVLLLPRALCLFGKNLKAKSFIVKRQNSCFAFCAFAFASCFFPFAQTRLYSRGKSKFRAFALLFKVEPRSTFEAKAKAKAFCLPR